MVSRKRFLKSIYDLNSLVKSQDPKKMGCNFSVLRGDSYIEINLFSIEENMEYDMWDMEILWDEIDQEVSIVVALFSKDDVKWHHLSQGIEELLVSNIIPSSIKEWVVFNMDLFIK